jgi:protein SCO1/2
MSVIRKLTASIFVLLALAGGTFFMVQAVQRGSVQPEFATVWPSPKPLPEFSLTDHSGQAFTKADLQGKWSLVFFGFTHCPDICPATLQQLSIANTRLTESSNDVPDIVLISVDPDRDSPQVMAAYVSHFSGEIRGVSGDIIELRKLTSAAGVFFEKSELPDGGYSVDHATAVLVINEDAAIHASFSAPHDIDSFVNDMPILMGSN